IIKQNQINLIQFHNLNFFQVISLVYPYFKKIPMVFFLHDFWPLCVYRNFMNPYEDFKMSGSCEKGCIKCVGLKAVIKQTIVKFIINRASVGIAPGKNIKNICENKGLLKGKWEIVIPWIKEIKNECNEYLMKNKNIFFVGPLLPYKGAWVLAKASKHIKTKDAAFHFIGQNQEESSVFFQKIKQEFNHNLDSFFVHGELKGKEFLFVLSKADVLVFPSICLEVFGQVWAEAMKLKIPVIASDIGGISEYVKDNGILFAPGDYVALAEKIDIVLNQDNKDMIEKGYEFVSKNCNIDKAYVEVKDIYLELGS
ncbi:glycosyltransferase, partial [bacterium]|nr:glycosyltransferase [bacterium]